MPEQNARCGQVCGGKLPIVSMNILCYTGNSSAGLRICRADRAEI